MIRLVGEPTTPSAPSPPQKQDNQTTQNNPKTQPDNATAWLKQLATQAYVLQLASMSERSSVKRIIQQKGLDNVRVVPLMRNGSRYFVLLSGTYESRPAADQAAERYKENFGISPWVRQVQDVAARLD